MSTAGFTVPGAGCQRFVGARVLQFLKTLGKHVLQYAWATAGAISTTGWFNARGYGQVDAQKKASWNCWLPPKPKPYVNQGNNYSPGGLNFCRVSRVESDGVWRGRLGIGIRPRNGHAW